PSASRTDPAAAGEKANDPLARLGVHDRVHRDLFAAAVGANDQLPVNPQLRVARRTAAEPARGRELRPVPDMGQLDAVPHRLQLEHRAERAAPAAGAGRVLLELVA